jgi:hypothetical protein
MVVVVVDSNMIAYMHDDEDEEEVTSLPYLKLTEPKGIRRRIYTDESTIMFQCFYYPCNYLQ